MSYDNELVEWAAMKLKEMFEIDDMDIASYVVSIAEDDDDDVNMDECIEMISNMITSAVPDIDVDMAIAFSKELLQRRVDVAVIESKKMEMLRAETAESNRVSLVEQIAAAITLNDDDDDDDNDNNGNSNGKDISVVKLTDDEIARRESLLKQFSYEETGPSNDVGKVNSNKAFAAQVLSQEKETMRQLHRKKVEKNKEDLAKDKARKEEAKAKRTTTKKEKRRG